MKLPSTPGTFLLLGSVGLALVPSASADTTIFVDDAGTTHEIDSKATIVTGAMDAVALSHFGFPSDRIIATFGERSSSGSNYGETYYDGNLVYGDELKHGDSDYDPDLFPSDPDTEERAYLNAITGDLSASCSASNYYCDIVDMNYLDENGWPDMIIVGAFYESIIKPDFIGNATKNNVPIVTLKNSYEGDESEIEARDMLDMIEIIETLALALGATEDAVVIGNDEASFCEAASSFREIAQTAQDNGVRSMASYMPYKGGNPQGLTGAFLPSPDSDPVLSMMQNLGMPILYNEHAGNYWEYHTDFSPGAGSFKAKDTGSLSGEALYHVDFWLYDDRVTLDFLSDQFAKDWPHPALLEKQHAYWPSNARILSYKHASEILNVVGAQLKDAQRVSPPTECVPFDGVAGTPRNLSPGEYSCASIKPISFCSAGDLGTEDTKKTDVIIPEEPAVDSSSSGQDSTMGKEESSDMSSSGPARIGTVLSTVVASVTLLLLSIFAE
jgi:hypothetical protein